MLPISTHRQFPYVGIRGVHTSVNLIILPTMALKGGIGAKGSAKARFFHPSQNIRDKWPNQHRTIQLEDVLVVGKAIHRVSRKDQLCYEVRIPEIDDSTIFIICCGNFKVDVEGATPFEDEVVVNAVVTAPTAQDVEVARVADI